MNTIETESGGVQSEGGGYHEHQHQWTEVDSRSLASAAFQNQHTAVPRLSSPQHAEVGATQSEHIARSVPYTSHGQ